MELGLHCAVGRPDGISEHGVTFQPALLAPAADLRLVGVLDEHGAGHRTDPTGVRRQPARNSIHARAEVADLVALDPVRADVDHGRTWLDHLLADEVGPAGRRDEYVRGQRMRRAILSPRVASS